MKCAFVALACAALGSMVSSCSSKPQANSPAAPPQNTASSAHSSALPPEALKGRTLLTKAQLDQAIDSGTLDRPVNSLLTVDGPLQFGDFVWNDKGIPAGPIWVRIDLAKQLLSVFRGGNEIGTGVVVYGGDNKKTPAGKFHILMKDRDHRSSLYDAAMPYTLQLTGDGVSIHGSTVRWGAATHGCIGLPLDFARRLFEQAKVGDEVVIVPPPKSPSPTA
jgi:lipoprotein-anchoring transpeptidase ErfK/SrfK